MNLPKSVKIGAMNYDINIVSDLYAKHSLYGEVTYSDQQISIASDINELRQLNAIIHEMTHAILFESGDYGLNDDEAFVRRFSNALTQVIVDNNWKIGEEETE